MVAGGVWKITTSRHREIAAQTRGVGALTLAATGDAIIVEPLRPEQLAAASGIAAVLASADVAITNLETILFDELPKAGGAPPLAATRAAAETLRALGINLVSRANNHAADYGAEGLENTARVLDAVGIQHVGAGGSLPDARRGVAIGDSPRRIAVIAVTASSAAEARATAPRGEIDARAGVNPLRYEARIVADPETFQVLKGTATQLHAGGGEATSDTFTFFGATIRKGERTEVTFVLDEQDLADIVDTVAVASAAADAVVVSVHSHEPSNEGDTPAEFLQRFARAAIDAGAALVVGHGPHRLRGIERYGRGVILYSLGNFIFQHHALDPRRADMFDAGADLYRVALGAWSPGAGMLVDYDQSIWGEGLVAQSAFANGAVSSLKLYPIQMSGAEGQGAPRLAGAAEATRILERVNRLSAPFGTTLAIRNGIGEVIDTAGH